MSLRGKKLGILISASPEQPNFERGVKLAETALAEGVLVYLYCIDEAVPGVQDPRLETLKERGLKLFACAYGAQRRSLALSDKATFAGLTVVTDLLTSTDRFLTFN